VTSCTAARPRFLTGLRDLLTAPPTGFDCARQCLDRGRPVGVFVEGTTNRDPTRLLRGRRGAARLSLDAGVPVLPVGLRFPEHDDPDRPIADDEPLSVHVGTPLVPPATDDLPRWHAAVMSAVADCANVQWAGADASPATIPA
jgi:1-acyl-sn-glycerol-3-phosphate acyltransferase